MKDERRPGDVLCEHCERSTPGTIVHRFLKDPENVLDEHHVQDLAIAVKLSGSVLAAECLDRLFRDEPMISEWIARGRGRV